MKSGYLPMLLQMELAINGLGYEMFHSANFFAVVRRSVRHMPQMLCSERLELPKDWEMMPEQPILKMIHAHLAE